MSSGQNSHGLRKMIELWYVQKARRNSKTQGKILDLLQEIAIN